MRSAGVVLSILLLLGCSSSPTEPDPGASFVVAYGSTGRSGEVRVTFAQLVEDSRCPASVVCAWQGNGAVRLEITAGGSTQSVTLHTAGGPAFPREASVAGYTVTLVELDPQRQTPDPVPPQQYRATVRIARVSS